MKFLAVDVETANSKRSSICQIGVVLFQNGVAIDSWHTLINPEEPFDKANINVHHITPCNVKRSPKFPQVADHIKLLLDGQTVVSHTTFDKVAINRVFKKYNLTPPS